MNLNGVSSDVVLVSQSLGVESKEDVYRLAEFFSNYQQRPTQQADVSRECHQTSIHPPLCSQRRMNSGDGDSLVVTPFFSHIQAEGFRHSFTASMTFELLHPDEVLAALKAFTAQYRRPRSDQIPSEHRDVFIIQSPT